MKRVQKSDIDLAAVVEHLLRSRNAANYLALGGETIEKDAALVAAGVVAQALRSIDNLMTEFVKQS